MAVSCSRSVRRIAVVQSSWPWTALRSTRKIVKVLWRALPGSKSLARSGSRAAHRDVPALSKAVELKRELDLDPVVVLDDLRLIRGARRATDELRILRRYRSAPDEASRSSNDFVHLPTRRASATR